MSQTRQNTPERIIEHGLQKLMEHLENAFCDAGAKRGFHEYKNSIQIHPDLNIADIDSYYHNLQKIHRRSLVDAYESEIPDADLKLFDCLTDLHCSLSKLISYYDSLSRIENKKYIGWACGEINRRLTSDLTLKPIAIDYTHFQLEQKNQKIYLLLNKFVLLSYINKNPLQPNSNLSRYSPGRSIQGLEDLPSIECLNEIITEIEDNRKRKIKDCQIEAVDDLQCEIEKIEKFKSELADFFDSMISDLEQLQKKVEDEINYHAEILSNLSGLARVFEHADQIELFQQEIKICGHALKRLESLCSTRITRFSLLNSAIISNPWRDVVTQSNALAKYLTIDFENYVLNEFEIEVEIKALKSTFKDHVERVESLNILRLSIKDLINATRYHKDILLNKLTDIILDCTLHLKSHDPEFIAFAKQHWGKVLAGSISGGGVAAAITILLLSTNPALLTTLIVSGVVIGGSSGAGIGLGMESLPLKHGLFARSVSQDEVRPHEPTEPSYRR